MYQQPPGHSAPQYSPDGRWWWDGQRWVPVGQAPVRPRSGGMGTGARVLLVGFGTVAALVVLIGVVAAAVLVVPRSVHRTSPSTGIGAVVFDDDFSTDHGWDVAPTSGFTTDLHLGHPGSMHLAVPAKDAGFHELYPGPAYSRVQFTATMANRTGGGDLGLLCDDPNSTGRYRFWAGTNGTAFIDLAHGPGKDASILAQTAAREWGEKETHTVTGVCSSDGKQVALQLLIDDKSVLQASSSSLTGPFTPGVLVQGPINVDLRRFVVTTT